MSRLLKRISCAVLAAAVVVPSLLISNVATTQAEGATYAEVNNGSYYVQDMEVVGGGTMGTQLNGLNLVTGDGASIEADDTYNNTPGGSYSLKTTTSTAGTFDIKTNFNGAVYPSVGDIVTFDWYCENIDEFERFMMHLADYAPSNDPSHEIYFGVYQQSSVNNGEIYFSYRYKTDGSVTGEEKVDVSGSLDTPIKNQAWNTFTIDYSQKGKVILYGNGDVENALEIPTSTGDFGGFNTAAIINWWGPASSYAGASLYFDNIKLTEPAQVPSNAVVDDVANTFAWTNHSSAESLYNYEYTIDGGNTWQLCTANPQSIGNRALDVETVGVRVISYSDDYVNPTLWNDVAYTKNTERYNTFEQLNDIYGLSFLNTAKNEVSEVYSRSGLSSLAVSSQTAQASNNSYQFEVNDAMGATVTDKIISIWYYDTMNTTASEGSFLVAPSINNANDHKTGLGVSNSKTYNGRSGKDYYYFREFGTGGQENMALVERTEGWHEFKWDYTGDDCLIYIDDVLVHTDVGSDGFNKVQIFDYWSTKQHTIYLDDLVIGDAEDVIMVADAPTNPVTDDENNTFGFTTVEGMEDLSAYEYSVDGGQTFATVTSNPIQLDEKGYDAGEVMVRLKAVDGGFAGAVLRSTVEFLDPEASYKEELEALYNKASSFYEGDYTAESFAGMDEALAAAKTALENEEGYEAATTALKAVVDGLVMDMPEIMTYSFNDGEESEIPFKIVNGSTDWGQYTNMSEHGVQALRVTTEQVGTSQVSKITYSFAELMEDKVVDFFFRDTKNGSTSVTFMDSTTNNGVKIYGGASYYFARTIIDGVESADITTGMRRNGDWYNLEFNFATNDGVKCYMDSRNWLNSSVIGAFDTIEISYSHNAMGEALTIDEFTIMDANPVTAINLNDESAEIGYYDSYEMNINNWTIETEKDYDTTDKFTWVSSNPDVAFVTTGGSIENHGVGEATVTVTASSGATASMDITCLDIKAESVQISGSDYNDAPNFIETVTIEPGSVKVVNAIISPAGVTNRNITWTTSDSTIVAVVDGELTALKEGTATVTATTADGGHKSSITVNVMEDNREYGVEVFVATDGNDVTGDGSIEAPFATIDRARDEIRSYSHIPNGGAVVYLRGGEYTMLNGVELETMDQGSASSPIKYSAYEDEYVNLVGTLNFEVSDATKVTDADILAKLPEVSKDAVYELDLSDYVTSDKEVQYVGHSMGNLSWLAGEGYNTSIPYISMTIDGSQQTLARWPNEGQEIPGRDEYPGYCAITHVVDPGANPRMWKDDVIGRDGWVAPEDRDKYDTFEIISDNLNERIGDWIGVPTDGTNMLDLDIYMSGYWQNDFSDQTVKIQDITMSGSDYIIESDIPSGYSVGTSHSTKFYVYNILQELDIPGEWYFDQEDGSYTMYFYPPTGVDMTSDTSLKIAMLEDTMFTLTDTKHITISGLNIEGVLNTGVEMLGTEYVAFKNATIAATQLKAGVINSTSKNTVMNSGFENVNFFDVNGGVSISGGDTMNLVSQNNYLQNCHFNNFATITQSYNPAVSISGVGNRITSCMIEDGPHNAIMYSGNDQVIEFTEITNVVQAAKDQAAIYTGRNVLQRGTVIRNNYFHDIEAGSGGNPNSGIYLDDLQAGADIIDNVFENVGWGIFINGGRDTHVQGNEFINCQDGVIINDWAYIGVNNWYIHGYGTLSDTNNVTNLTDEPWNDPESAYGKYEHLWTIREDDPWHSKYNTIIDNTFTDGKNSLVRYMSRAVQNNYVDVLNDWYFIKDNTEN